MTGDIAAPRIRGLVRLLHRVEDGLLVFLLLAMLALAVSQIAMRNFMGVGFIWIDPLLRVMVLWLGLVGALVATREGKQISVDVLTRVLTPRLSLVGGVMTRAFAGTVSAIIAWYSLLFVIDEWKTGITAFANVPAWTTEAIIPIGFGLMALRFLLQGSLSAAELYRGMGQ